MLSFPKNLEKCCEDIFLTFFGRNLFCCHIRQQMATEKVPKVPQKYACEPCDYITSRYSQYLRHTATVKHQKGHLATEFNKKVPKGSRKHKKTCTWAAAA